MAVGKWLKREQKLDSGRIVRWRERQNKDGTVERVFDEDGGFERISAAQPVNVRAA